MLNLVATVTDPDTDKFIYEEDCVQMAIAMPGEHAVAGMLMINARGSRLGFGKGRQWLTATSLHASGWHMEITIPVPSDMQSVGLSVHRYSAESPAKCTASQTTSPTRSILRSLPASSCAAKGRYRA